MKRLLLLFVSFSLLSCSGDDVETNNNSSELNPPNWIQGTWMHISDDGFNTGVGYEFKPHDVCTLLSGFVNCNAQIIESNPDAIVTETVTDAEYKLRLQTSAGDITYHFQKISAAKIKWLGTVNHILTKQ